MKYIVSNILDEIEGDGVDQLRSDLSFFLCPKNCEIEDFIKNKAIEFAKGKLSITYLVNDYNTGAILGFFTLTHKSVIIKGESLSFTSKKRLARYSRKDLGTGNYMTSAFLLAQFGKNYAIKEENRISGGDLMQLATDILVKIQRQIGGGIVYLECEDNHRLVDFYSNQNYKRFDERISLEDDQKYVQMMRFF